MLTRSYNVTSLLQETILLDLLQYQSFPQDCSSLWTAQTWIPSVGCSPPSNRLLQCRLPSDSQPSGSHLPQCGPPWTAGNICSTANLHRPRGYSLPSYHGLPRSLCCGAPSPAHLLWAWCLHSCFFHMPCLSSLQGKKTPVCQNLFPLLNVLQVLIGLALSTGGSKLELEELLEVSYRSHVCSPCLTSKTSQPQRQHSCH